MQAKVISGQAPGGARQKLADALPLDTPYVVHIFPTYACNFKCNYCIFSVEKKQRQFISDKTNLSYDLHLKTVNEMKAFPSKIKTLRYVGIGEPLLHNRIADMIRDASEANIAQRIEVVTNASLLTPEMSDKLLQSGLNRIVISLQGTSSEKYRDVCGANIDFEQFLSNLTYFYRNSGDTDVYLKIVDYALDDEADKQRFFDIFGPIADSIAVENTVPIYPGVDYKGILNSGDNPVTQFGLPLLNINVCPQPFFTIQLNPDGKVVPCYSLVYPDIIGDCNQENIVDIWNGKKFNQFRLKILNGLSSQKSICSDCNIIRYRIFEEDKLDDVADTLKKFYGELSDSK